MNKKMKLSVFAIVTLVGLFAGFFGNVPTVSAMTCDSATLTGTVDTGTPPTHARFVYSSRGYDAVASGGGVQTTVQVFNSEGSFPIQQFISGLSANTKYWFMLQVSNNYGTQNLNVESFTTPSCATQGGTGSTTTAPNVTTDPATNITASNATLNGTVNGNGVATNAWFKYGTNPNNFPYQTAPIPYGTGFSSLSAGISNSFSVGDTIYFQAGAINSQGVTAVGSVQSFKFLTVTPPPPANCMDTRATNYGYPLPCNIPPPPVQNCMDTRASNYGYPLPCNIPPPPAQTCNDVNADNPGSTGVCTYLRCHNPYATNPGGLLPCTFFQPQQTTNTSAQPINIVNTNNNNNSSNNSSNNSNVNNNGGGGNVSAQTCTDPSANNYGGVGNCTYSQICRDTSSINYGGALPCRYSVQTCLDTNASNYGSAGTCFYAQVCRDFNAINYNGTLPCRYNNVNNQVSVNISADSTSVPFNGATFIRWYSTNATSCFASGGSVGWAGTKSIGPASFYTGSLSTGSTYTITCSNSYGSATDSVAVSVRAQTNTITTNTVTNTVVRPPATSLVLITSSIDRNQPIVPTLDNTRPKPGDEINYTVSYQNIGTGSITNLTLRIDLPREVSYMFSNPANPTIAGNTLLFNLGTLRANGQGTVTVRVRVLDNIPEGTNLNFPAILSYVDPSGFPQSVTANVSAQVFSQPTIEVPSPTQLGASVFGAGFLPNSFFGWLLLLVLILILLALSNYLYRQISGPRTTTIITPGH